MPAIKVQSTRANVPNRNEWKDISGGGVFQKEITATAGLFKVAKSNGIAWRNYGTLPSEIYISYE